MSYSYNASDNPQYILNKDVDRDSNRGDQFEMYFLGEKYLIFSNDHDDAKKQAEEIYNNVKNNYVKINKGEIKMSDYGYTIDEIVEKLLKFKNFVGNVEAMILQVGDEDENGNAPEWDAHISSVELDVDKDGNAVVRIY